MPTEFNMLNEQEQQQMFDAIPLITLLIATADGHIDEKELQWAQKVADIRSYQTNGKFNDYFEQVSQTLGERLAHFQLQLPTVNVERVQFLSDKLAELNPILHKMDDFDAANYVANFRSFAKHVAESSGGIMGFMTVSKAEEALLDLPMLEDFQI